MSMAVYNSEERIRLFMSYPFQMVDTIETQANIPFPSVTVCSAFPLPVLGNASVRAREIIDSVKNKQCYTNSSLREYIAETVSNRGYLMPTTNILLLLFSLQCHGN